MRDEPCGTGRDRGFQHQTRRRDRAGSAARGTAPRPARRPGTGSLSGRPRRRRSARGRPATATAVLVLDQQGRGQRGLEPAAPDPPDQAVRRPRTGPEGGHQHAGVEDQEWEHRGRLPAAPPRGNAHESVRHPSAAGPPRSVPRQGFGAGGSVAASDSAGRNAERRAKAVPTLPSGTCQAPAVALVTDFPTPGQ